MAKKPKVANAFETVVPKSEVPEAGTVVTHEDGSTEVFNPPAVREKTKQELNAEAAAAKIAAKAEKAAAAAAKKEAAEAEKAEKAKIRAEAAAANKEKRAALLATLGEKRTYVGSMLALTERAKSGAYVKAATGQLRSVDALAEALDAVPVDNVIRLAKIVLGEEENKYAKLNIGQQSMNYRNRLRGALKTGKTTIDAIKAVIAENEFDTYKGWAEKKAAEKVAKAEAAAAKKAEKEAAAALKKAKQTETVAEAA